MVTDGKLKPSNEAALVLWLVPSGVSKLTVCPGRGAFAAKTREVQAPWDTLVTPLQDQAAHLLLPLHSAFCKDNPKHLKKMKIVQSKASDAVP